jgi:hypothetical protein
MAALDVALKYIRRAPKEVHTLSEIGGQCALAGRMTSTGMIAAGNSMPPSDHGSKSAH